MKLSGKVSKAAGACCCSVVCADTQGHVCWHLAVIIFSFDKLFFGGVLTVVCTYHPSMNIIVLITEPLFASSSVNQRDLKCNLKDSFSFLDPLSRLLNLFFPSNIHVRYLLYSDMVLLPLLNMVLASKLKIITWPWVWKLCGDLL